MVRLFYDSAVLPQLLEGETPLFVTVPAEVVRQMDREGVVSGLISKFEAIHLTYSGSALPIQDVQLLYRQAAAKHCSIIVAVGGGTVIDIAKILAVGISNGLSDIENILDNPTGFINTIPVICVPTTCGTGSEATHFAVVYRNRRKYSIAHQSMRPGITILDWRFLVSLPDKVRNATVLDALSQAVESIWANGATDESRQYAGDAIGYILKGMNSPVVERMLRCFHYGSHLSGKAIDISKTTLAHAISYPLTARFGIPHGVAVFLTLPAIAELNCNEGASDSFKMLFDIFRVDSIDAFIDRLRELMTGMGFSRHLSDWGVTEGELSSIAAESIVPGRSDNNPVPVSPDAVSEILRSIL